MQKEYRNKKRYHNIYQHLLDVVLLGSLALCTAIRPYVMDCFFTVVSPYRCFTQGKGLALSHTVFPAFAATVRSLTSASD